MKQNVIEVVNNKQSQKFEKLVGEWNSKHINVTHKVEEVWKTRMGQFAGNRNLKAGEKDQPVWSQKPFVVVEIYHKEVQVYRAFKQFDSEPNNKQLRAGFEHLYQEFLDHAKSMVMLKFLHYYDSVTEQPQEEVKEKVKIIKPHEIT